MSENNYQVHIDSFYYNSPNQAGLQITAMSPSIPASLRVPLENFMCTIACGGNQLDERLVFCPPLGGFCKIFISRDALYARDYFYHTATIAEKTFNNEFTHSQDKFVNRLRALLLTTSTADSRNREKDLPRATAVFPVCDADAVSAMYKQDRTQLSRLVYLAFKPVLSLGKFSSVFRFPAEAQAGAMNSLSAHTALFVLSVLPEEMHNKVRMRFTADPETLQTTYDCNYLFACGNTNAHFDAENSAPLREEEDPLGIFTALGTYIAVYGLAAYRNNILPLVQKWTVACVQGGHFSLDFLYLLLRGVQELKLPAKQVDLHVTGQFFGKMDEQWFSQCAVFLLPSLRNLPDTKQARAAMEDNALFNRTVTDLPADGNDPFFLLYAGLCSGASYDEKAAVLQTLFARYGEAKNGYALLLNMKSVMALTLKVPEDATPGNIFEGVRALERTNPDYAKYAADAAADGYVDTQDEEWINCLHTLHSDPATAQAVSEVLDIRNEDLLAAAQDRKTIGWVCSVCKQRAAADPVFRQTVISALAEKMISYEELLHCLRAMGASEQDLPEPPKAKKLSESVDSLQTLAEVKLPKKGEDISAVQAGILERLCLLLENDCTWADFRKYIPEILANAKFRPTMRIQPKIEKLLLRQLSVLATDILTVQGGQSAYVELLVQLRRDFCLCLYPVSGAAAGKFDEKKGKANAFGNALRSLLPHVILFLTLFVVVTILFILVPVLPADSVLQLIVPAIFCGLGVLLILVQTLIVRRHTTAEFLLPCAVVMLAAGLLQLLW
ncbi:MAG: hypothetical protein E7523_04635 [Ruminococcaceae bacterium]|nr:hypothetical protein [Oscillospiraceae bacterium]